MPKPNSAYLIERVYDALHRAGIPDLPAICATRDLLFAVSEYLTEDECELARKELDTSEEIVLAKLVMKKAHDDQQN